MLVKLLSDYMALHFESSVLFEYRVNPFGVNS